MKRALTIAVLLGETAMRHLDTLPAWATRHRNRLLVRHSDHKVVRWINHRPLTRGSSEAEREEDAGSVEASSNDNLLTFGKTLIAQAH